MNNNFYTSEKFIIFNCCGFSTKVNCAFRLQENIKNYQNLTLWNNKNKNIFYIIDQIMVCHLCIECLLKLSLHFVSLNQNNSEKIEFYTTLFFSSHLDSLLTLFFFFFFFSSPALDSPRKCIFNFFFSSSSFRISRRGLNDFLYFSLKNNR